MGPSVSKVIRIAARVEKNRPVELGEQVARNAIELATMPRDASALPVIARPTKLKTSDVHKLCFWRGARIADTAPAKPVESARDSQATK
jgi:hypothetical protein